MLEELKISNLAVVEDAAIEFAEGLNVMTGSTGAGKSIILAAVELLSGSRARKSFLRKGTMSLSVEGTFKTPDGWRMKGKTGMEEGENRLSIKREVKDDGRSRIWVNGMACTNTLAREVTDSLLELHGQHGHQELLDPSCHMRLLDASGDYGSILDESAGYEDLERRIRRLENIHRYNAALEQSLILLSEGDEAVNGSLSSVEKALGSIGAIDEKWKEMAGMIAGMRISLQDMAREIERSIGGDADEREDLEELQDRLATIQRACRKYRLDCAGLVGKRDELSKVLHSLSGGSDDIAAARRELREAAGRLVPVLERLSERRKSHAASIDGEVTAELQLLGMEGAVFRTRIGRKEIKAFHEGCDEIDLGPGGLDDVEFMIRTNVGEEMHPLAEVASGGELSRITLVLKKLLVREKGIPTLVFDEIDSGLGADLGSVVAASMKQLSGRYQIICITHLPQVAAAGDQHILIKKDVRRGRTVTEAKVLSGDERKAELARMLGGKGILREKLATELLDDGKSARSSAG
ncbi:MAG: AAA family ATPase [Candidatus Krumholzibacteria bacterium]|nr:AAA family ATPase [Candidatus Krumholzibacteria bacterium]